MRIFYLLVFINIVVISIIYDVSSFVLKFYGFMIIEDADKAFFFCLCCDLGFFFYLILVIYFEGVVAGRFIL